MQLPRGEKKVGAESVARAFGILLWWFIITTAARGLHGSIDVVSQPSVTLLHNYYATLAEVERSAGQKVQQ